MPEPLIPPTLVVVGLVLPVLVLLLTVVALVSIVKFQSVTPSERASWIIGSLLVPGVVPAIWLVLYLIERRILGRATNT